jgi:hypothetical protein
MQDPKTVLLHLQSWAKENPNRKREVIPIEISAVSDTQEGEDAPATVAGGWIPTPLEPPGPLALYLWKTDPEFRGGSPPVRRTILRDTILAVTLRVESELRGVKWHRKKVVEQLAAQQTSAVSPPMDTPELDTALCSLYGYQKVVADEANKKIFFFPSDPRTWSTDLPVWGSTAGSRAVLHRSGEEPVSRNLAIWLGDRERDGWKIDWPVSDGTLEEIKKQMLERGTGVGPSITKPKKADYAAAWGRSEAITVLSKF